MDAQRSRDLPGRSATQRRLAAADCPHRSILRRCREHGREALGYFQPIRATRDAAQPHGEFGMRAAMTDDLKLVGLNEIRAAADRIAPYIFATPIVPMTPSGIRLKAENLQPIGAFKIRGAFNAILSLSEGEKRRGTIAHSSGNHAQAVAYTANRLGIKAVIVMPENAPAVKLEGTRRWGA